jgi:two-component system, OmpR family, sensor histidine kinase KdpD
MSADTLHQGPVPPGRLRIYLGYAPGAGTTCALLSEGHQRAAHGTDVVVAIAETHGRPHTAGLLLGLEVIPPLRPHTTGRQLRRWTLTRCWPAGPRSL